MANETLKPGQKFPTPTRGFGDRVFYETLLRQNPASAMAQEWCVHNGVLPEQEASKLYKIVLKRRGKSVASVGVAGGKRKSGGGKKKKAVILSDNDGGLGVGGGVDEGIGTAVI
mmetsp:Transcript_31791/g.37910  ORF Transcript_31791/g.37910 Transcript_31791/m.37910 type:complete len:114 (+) Transcript_31791:207-548(+)